MLNARRAAAYVIALAFCCFPSAAFLLEGGSALLNPPLRLHALYTLPLQVLAQRALRSLRELRASLRAAQLVLELLNPE